MPELPCVLLIDDDAEVLDAYRQTLELEGFAVRASRDPRAALASLTPAFEGAVLSDVRMPGVDGMTALKLIGDIDSEIPVLLFTGHGGVDLAVQAVRNGAYDFIEKPADPVRLVESLRRACAHRRLVLENRALRQSAYEGDGLDARLIGRTPAMEALRKMVAAAADTQADVLVLGETGSGKDLIARCLHDFSRRSAHPFVAINCGALPEAMIEGELFGHEPGAFTGAKERRIGKIEFSSRGTLFLDEIESMPMLAQVRLLRVLQERTVTRLGSNKEIPLDMRVVAATKVDLKALAAKGLFREDLYYRLNVIVLKAPPLRERAADAPLLFKRYLDLAAKRHGRPAPNLSRRDLDAIASYAWPGNVRELRNAAERMALGLGAPTPEAEGEHAPTAHARCAEPLATIMDRAELAAIEAALERCGGKIARTAGELGLTRKTLYLKMRRFGIDKSGYRDGLSSEADDTEMDD